jgi:CysZ protein
MNEVVNNNSGAGYFFKGLELITTKGIKRFVFVPLIVNFLLFGAAFYYLFTQLDQYMAQVVSWLPSWLAWLNTFVWPLVALIILIVFSFIFSAIANFIAAPFNGLLAEKMEILLTEDNIRLEHSAEASFAIIKDIPRTLSREWCKLRYYLPRAIGFFILSWLLPIFGQLLWFLFIAWMMAIQYKDYPFDNHKVPFDVMRAALKEHKGLSYSFGLTVTLFSMIPLVNLIVMPVAICGATALWVDHYQRSFIGQPKH